MGPSVDWRVPSTPSRLRLTSCFRLLRMPRRSLRRRWWTLPVELTNSVLNRITPLLRLLPSSLYLTNWHTWGDVCLTLKPLLLEVARLPWPSWRARSVTLRPSLPTHRHALESLLRLIRVLNESARSSSSLLARTRRTRIACPTLLLSCSLRSRLTSSRLKRLRRSLLSTWPSSGRPSRSWRRPRRGPSLLPSSKLQTLERTVKLEENLFAANSHIS